MDRTIDHRPATRFFDMDLVFIIALFAYIGLNDVNTIVSISVGIVLVIAGVTWVVLMIRQIKNAKKDDLIKDEELKRLRRENEKG